MTQRAKDVVVVGGGVVGAACAYYLARAGRRVTVVDRGEFGGACSFANCGFVCPSHVLPLAGPGAIRATLAVMTRPDSPVRASPREVLRNARWFLGFARRCTARHAATAGTALHGLLGSARRLYEDWVRDERLDCDWDTRGLLFVFRSAAAMGHFAETDRLLRDRFDTPARRLGPDALAGLEPGLRPGLAGGWLYERDAHLRPDRLMAELRRVLVGLGVRVLDRTPVTGLTRAGGRVTGVETGADVIPADDVVVATGAWAPGLAGAIGCRVPIIPGKGYSVTYPTNDTGLRTPIIFEEDRVAVTPFSSGLRLGSMMEFTGYDTGLDPARLGLLTATANTYLRTPVPGTPTESWYGWRPMTPDGLPMIGPAPAAANLWLAAGHNMLGLSLAPSTGKLVAEMMTGSQPHLDPTPFAVGRF